MDQNKTKTPPAQSTLVPASNDKSSAYYTAQDSIERKCLDCNQIVKPNTGVVIYPSNGSAPVYTCDWCHSQGGV